MLPKKKIKHGHFRLDVNISQLSIKIPKKEKKSLKIRKGLIRNWIHTMNT